MDDWQGPAIWIYNDKEFSDKDFQALIKLGIGGKSRDENENDTRIGRFGIGFNCAFHITDLPSFVSGEYIAFLDLHEKYLPAQGYPPKRRKGIKINFKKKDFKRSFPDQCYLYETIKGCDFKEDFKGCNFTENSKEHCLDFRLGRKKVKFQIRSLKSEQSCKNLMVFRVIKKCSF